MNVYCIRHIDLASANKVWMIIGMYYVYDCKTRLKRLAVSKAAENCCRLQRLEKIPGLRESDNNLMRIREDCDKNFTRI